MPLQDANGNIVSPPIVIKGFQYSANIEQIWTDQQLAAIGLVRVAAPPDNPVPPNIISDRQFFHKLATTPNANGVGTIISEAEALAAVCTGSVPAALQEILAVLPADEQFAARMKIAGATQFDLTDPVTLEIAKVYGWSTAELSAFWMAASEL